MLSSRSVKYCNPSSSQQRQRVGAGRNLEIICSASSNSREERATREVKGSAHKQETWALGFQALSTLAPLSQQREAWGVGELLSIGKLHKAGTEDFRWWPVKSTKGVWNGRVLQHLCALPKERRRVPSGLLAAVIHRGPVWTLDGATWAAVTWALVKELGGH